VKNAVKGLLRERERERKRKKEKERENNLFIKRIEISISRPQGRNTSEIEYSLVP